MMSKTNSPSSCTSRFKLKHQLHLVLHLHQINLNSWVVLVSPFKILPLVTVARYFPQCSGLAAWAPSVLPHVRTYCQKLLKPTNSCLPAQQAWAHLCDLGLNNSKPGGACLRVRHTLSGVVNACWVHLCLSVLRLRVSQILNRGVCACLCDKPAHPAAREALTLPC